MKKPCFWKAAIPVIFSMLLLSAVLNRPIYAVEVEETQKDISVPDQDEIEFLRSLSYWIFENHFDWSDDGPFAEYNWRDLSKWDEFLTNWDIYSSDLSVEEKGYAFEYYYWEDNPEIDHDSSDHTFVVDISYLLNALNGLLYDVEPKDIEYFIDRYVVEQTGDKYKLPGIVIDGPYLPFYFDFVDDIEINQNSLSISGRLKVAEDSAELMPRDDKRYISTFLKKEVEGKQYWAFNEIQVFDTDLDNIDMGNTDLVSSVQKKLNDLGYDCGIVDGDAGPKTKQGIIEYQKAHNIRQDGMISKDLLAELWIAEYVKGTDVQIQKVPFLTYINERFGYAISYPSYFTQSRPLPANGDGIWMSGNGANLTMSGSYNAMNDTPESYSRYSAYETGITESIAGEDYYEYYRIEGNTEEYSYTKIDDLDVSFVLEYPVTEHEQYSKIIEKMKKSVVVHAVDPAW